MSVRDDAISAHGGGELIDLKAPASERPALAAHAAKLASITLNARDIADLEMLATGAFSPLTGFMGEADYTRARDEMLARTHTKVAPWTIVRADHKHRTHMNVMRDLLSRLDYDEKDASLLYADKDVVFEYPGGKPSKGLLTP